jgi:hypothetical protein
VAPLDPHAPEPTDPSVDVRGRGVRVEGYEGVRAGEAVVAVRRLGLRPALERVEGYESGLHGFVVSQEPERGCEVQPGGLVSLFIAAPSRTITDGSPPVAGEESEVDVESLHVGDPLYADDTVEIREIGASENNSREPDEAFDEDELAADEDERWEDAHEPPVDDDEPAREDEELPVDDDLDVEAADDGEDGDADADYELPSEAVWHGSPSAGRHSHLRKHTREARGTRPRRVWSAAGVRWGGFAVFVGASIALLLVIAANYHPASQRPSPRKSRSAQRTLPPSRSRAPVRVVACSDGCPRATRPLGLVAVRRSGSQRSGRTPAGVSQRSVSLHAVAPVATAVQASSVPVELSGVSAEEHAAMEFGP